MQAELSPSERIQQSYAGQMGRLVEPVFRAMGLDWRVGVALNASCLCGQGGFCVSPWSWFLA